MTSDSARRMFAVREHTPTVPHPGATEHPRRRRRVQRRTQKPGTPPVTSNPSTTAGAPPAFGTAPLDRSRSLAADLRRGREARAGDAHAGRATDGGRQLASDDGELSRAANRPAEGRARRHGGAGNALESGVGRHAARPYARPIRAQHHDAGPLPQSDDEIAFAPVTRLVALDRDAKAQLRASHEHLSRAHREVRFQAPVRHHADARPRARAREEGGRRDRRGQVQGSAARHSIWREGSARHREHRDDLWRRAVQRSRADGRQRGGRASRPGRRGADRQAQPRRARAERHLVRRADDESVAAGRGRVGIERRARRGDGGGASRILYRQRERAEASSARRCAAASRDCVRRSGACRAPAR